MVDFLSCLMYYNIRKKQERKGKVKIMTRVDVDADWELKILYFENEKLEKELSALKEKRLLLQSQRIIEASN